MSDVVALSGNPRPGSRTVAFARAAAETVAELLGDAPESVVTLDLAQPDRSPDAVRDTVASASVAVVASPTYKGTYTGLLKQLLDGYDRGGLDGLIAVPLMVNAAPAHTLAADLHLRPLLLELGATCPTPAIVAAESDLGEPEALLGAWAARAGWALRALAAAPDRPSPLQRAA